MGEYNGGIRYKGGIREISYHRIRSIGNMMYAN